VNIAIVLGTRPEIIKCASTIKALDSSTIIHTGQHYMDRLSEIFFAELDLPSPTINLNIGSGTHHIQIAKMVAGLHEHLRILMPDIVVVQGDTNSSLAGAVAAHRLGIPVAHIESGLRSFDRTMPEETNRVIIDHISTQLFAPTKQSADNLKKENLTGAVITGNTSIDALVRYMPKARTADKEMNKGRILITLHRPFNVDNLERFESIINKIATSINGNDAIIPVHPRIRHKIKWPNNVRHIAPLGYLEFIWAMKEAPLIITDSGGIQEEACYLRVPCITLRPNTERPETLAIGANVLSKKEDLPVNIERMLFSNRKWTCPYGNGTAYKTIVTKMKELLIRS
jgi:UDP-N-acetylglucosamine 2-epimerase (non-hydrolysing)